MEDSGFFLTGYSGILAESGSEGAFDFENPTAVNVLADAQYTVSPVMNPSGYMKVNPAIVNDVLSVAAAKPNSDGTVEIGDASSALEIASLRNSKVMIGNADTFDDYFADAVTNVGLKGEQAQMNLENQTAIMADLRTMRDSISGVNIDEELADIIKFQHGYNAAAKLISIMDNLLDTVINGLV